MAGALARCPIENPLKEPALGTVTSGVPAPRDLPPVETTAHSMYSSSGMPVRTQNPDCIGEPAQPVVLDGFLPTANFLIIDDCTLHRENLAAVMAAHSDSTPAVAWDLPSVCAALSQPTPDIVLLNMGTRDGVMLLRVVRETCPDAKVIAVGISEDDESQIVACAEAGVAGYHMRAESLDDLMLLMSRVASGESLCSPKVSAILLRRLSALAALRQPAAKELVLTAREAQILRLLESGLSNRAIADRLCIALHTVKNHVHSVLGKLGVNSRAEAAAYSRSTRHPLLTEEY
ncbi:LuxR C-terminal-related transcriptional regulator [Mycolicibacterium baixiangningiae]|uniref:LuxR C-terminal-related transcriptional regulator n=1 Tax=Mycolicibacterium baixiangningiae TaxID=2761578 RepID=UPI001865BF22|nr:response regulator transcription factor [Mycolicibacterium baixiangningiae]